MFDAMARTVRIGKVLTEFPSVFQKPPDLLNRAVVNVCFGAFSVVLHLV